MNDQYDKYKEIAAGLAVLGSIVYAFHLFMDWTGIPSDLEANFGLAVKDLFWVVSVVLLIIAGARFLHHYGIAGAGANAIGTGPREKYDALRKSLGAHEDAKDGYARRLKAFLAKVDALFGDTDVTKQRFFLLRERAALWTAPALDRCLLLALLYPIATLFLIWAISGHVGPAERALGLKPDNSGWVRSLWVGAIVLLGFILWTFARIRGRTSSAWSAVAIAVSGGVVGGGIIASILSGAVAIAIAAGVAGAINIAIVVAGADARADPVAGVGAIALLGAMAVSGAISSYTYRDASGVGAIGMAISMASGGAVMFLSSVAVKHRWQNFFLSLFLPLMVFGCLGLAVALSSLKSWEVVGPFLLFLGLFTLLNAPFDWLSLGLTRFLLRRGIEQGGPWPYFYALIDALAASALIALLAVAMVGATDLFDHLAELGGGDKARVLPPMRVFLDDLRAAPQKPEYWWVYATLFSTMLPSVINLFFAGFSFLRGLPKLRNWLLSVMREGEAMPATDRLGAALILTSQGVVALLFAVAAQVVLTWGVIYHFMPRLGLGILDLAKKVAM